MLERLFLLFLLLHQTVGQVKKCTTFPSSGRYIYGCDEDSVNAGSEAHCRCLHSCRPFPLKCRKNGTFERMDIGAYCDELATYTLGIGSSGRNFQITYEDGGFIDQCQGETVKVHQRDLCIDGRIKLDYFPLCEHMCHNPPGELKCWREFLHKKNVMECRCKENCLPVELRCGNSQQWIYNKTICSAPYSSRQIELDRTNNNYYDRSVIASYTPVPNMRVYPEVQCSEGYKTIKPGQITCPNGNITVSRLPTCGKICTTFPEKLRCEDTSEVKYLGSRTCTCLNSCQPVTIHCNADGRWSDFIYQCSNQYVAWNHTMPNGENVIVSYNSVELLRRTAFLNVTCHSGIQTIKTMGKFTCINGILNTTHLPVCEKNSTRSSIVNFTDSPLLYILIFLFACIVGIAITVYVIAKKKIRSRNTIENDDVFYDEIELRLAQQNVPPPPPEVPPRVRDAFGYLIVKKPYHYDVVRDAKPLEPWIKPVLDKVVEK